MKIKRKIYWNLCLVALLAMAVSALITALLLCQDLQTQMRQSVMTEVRYLESAMDVSGEEYLAHLKSRGDGNSVNRITWVSPDGEVLYDSFADSESLENHKDRPEIAAALKNGRGESVRTSHTLAEQTYYYAARLDDGSVFRVASTTKSRAGHGSTYHSGHDCHGYPDRGGCSDFGRISDQADRGTD